MGGSRPIADPTIAAGVAYERLAPVCRFRRARPLQPAQPCSGPLVSSRNQQLRLFSDRYNQLDFEDQAVGISIGPDGLTQITGFPTLGVIQ